MNGLWHFFWPALVACAVIGGIAGALAFLPRHGRRRRNLTLAGGAVAALAAAGIWYGPLGAAARLTGSVETRARDLLVTYEMGHIQARLHRTPLSRRLVLTGQADDFQRGELERMMEELPGVGEAVWDPSSLDAEPSQ